MKTENPRNAETLRNCLRAISDRGDDVRLILASFTTLSKELRFEYTTEDTKLYGVPLITTNYIKGFLVVYE